MWHGRLACDVLGSRSGRPCHACDRIHLAERDDYLDSNFSCLSWSDVSWSSLSVIFTN